MPAYISDTLRRKVAERAKHRCEYCQTAQRISGGQMHIEQIITLAQDGYVVTKKQEEIFNPVKDKIYKAIEEVAKKEGMQFVFDKSGDIILLYADPQYDITYKVLDKLKTGGK